jgi:hypothetical protein
MPVLLLLLAVSVGLFCWVGGRPGATNNNVDEEVIWRVISTDGKPVPVLLDWFSKEKLDEMVAADDRVGQAAFVQSGRMFTLAAGTRIRVVERRPAPGGRAGFAKVEILDPPGGSAIISESYLGK